MHFGDTVEIEAVSHKIVGKISVCSKCQRRLVHWTITAKILFTRFDEL